MSHMQTGMMTTGQLDGLAGRRQAGLLAADEGMEADVRVVATLESRLHVLIDDGRIFAMSHDRQAGTAEDAVEGLLTVYQHIAGGTAHEQLDAGYAVDVELVEQPGIVVGGSEEERIVDVTAVRGYAELLVQSLERGGLRHRVGHVEERGDATGSGSPALALDGSLVGEARLTEMHMRVDDARHDHAARSVYRLVDGLCGLGVFSF